MTRIRSSRRFQIENGTSLLGFDSTGGGYWKTWDRFLTVEGKAAYHLGNICGTCPFFFERLDGANQLIDAAAIRDAVNAGIDSVEVEAAQCFQALLPNGNYKALLFDIAPRMVALGTSDDYFANEQVQTWGLDLFWNLPHDPRVQYYRGNTRCFDAHATLFGFLIPMIPYNWLDQNRVTDYLDSTCQPTAVALSVLDVKQRRFSAGPERDERLRALVLGALSA